MPQCICTMSFATKKMLTQHQTTCVNGGKEQKKSDAAAKKANTKKTNKKDKKDKKDKNEKKEKKEKTTTDPLQSISKCIELLTDMLAQKTSTPIDAIVNAPATSQWAGKRYSDAIKTRRGRNLLRWHFQHNTPALDPSCSKADIEFAKGCAQYQKNLIEDWFKHENIDVHVKEQSDLKRLKTSDQNTQEPKEQ